MTFMVNENVALLSGRIFGLDSQLLFDVLIQGCAVFLLFIFLSYILINPVRKVLENRQEKVKNDLESAAKDREDAAKLKTEYDAKLQNADAEADEILSAARKKAVKNEENIVAEAKEEAARIISRALQLLWQVSLLMVSLMIKSRLSLSMKHLRKWVMIHGKTSRYNLWQCFVRAWL